MKDLVVGASVNFVGKLARSTRGVFLFVVGWLCGLDVVGDYSLSWGMVATLNKVARFGLLRGVVCQGVGSQHPQRKVVHLALLPLHKDVEAGKVLLLALVYKVAFVFHMRVCRSIESPKDDA